MKPGNTQVCRRDSRNCTKNECDVLVFLISAADVKHDFHTKSELKRSQNSQFTFICQHIAFPNNVKAITDRITLGQRQQKSNLLQNITTINFILDKF